MRRYDGVIARFFAVALTAGLSTLDANAQSWPAKPVRVIVSTGPGLATDIMARLVGAHFTARLGVTPRGDLQGKVHETPCYDEQRYYDNSRVAPPTS